MALYIPHSIYHLARLLYVSPETFGPYYVHLGNTFASVYGMRRRFTQLTFPLMFPQVMRPQSLVPDRTSLLQVPVALK